MGPLTFKDRLLEALEWPLAIAGVMAFVFFLSLLASCASVPVGGDFCAVEHPTRLSGATIDAMTDAEVNDAVAHNRKGQKLCGWKP